MLHPVGELPARVYWRRRLVLLTVLVVILGGGVGLAVTLLAGRDGGDAAASGGASPVPVPALERVVPSLSAVTTPEPPPGTAAAEPPVTAPGPVAGGTCTDEMLAVEVRTPASAAIGDKPTFELVVTNVSAVPCMRALDKELQEIVMFDGAGNRVWGSNDCFPEAGSDPRTLAPGEVVTVPLVWGGLTSEPTCTTPRSAPPPGNYVVRGRLDTKSSPDAPFALS